ncbi:MAG: hypothetical protein AAB584_00570 [Patescibacteria group bacterium]
MENKVLYHGSNTSGIKIFKPSAHKAVGGKEVVFATDNELYALAMIHGTGDQLAVSFSINSQTGEKEMYVDELEKGKLDLLNAPGFIYTVEENYFQKSPEELEGEHVSFTNVPVLSERKIENIKDELKSKGVYLIPYEKVPRSMQERGKSTGNPEKEHAPDRFK